MNQSAIVELVLFKLVGGSNEEDFLSAAQGINPQLEEMHGFIERRLLRNGEQWVDIVYWDSLEEAQSAAEAIMTLEAGQKFGAFIEQATMQFMHLHPVDVLTKA
ncbi:MAG: hypothetical protein RLP44_28335 [Aggregatilineales bacterium]